MGRLKNATFTIKKFEEKMVYTIYPKNGKVAECEGLLENVNDKNASVRIGDKRVEKERLNILQFKENGKWFKRPR